MAKPENVARFFRYLAQLAEGLPLSHALVADRIERRQFLDDVSYLRELLPDLYPDGVLESVGDGQYQLRRGQGRTRLEEAEFLPFLSALVHTTNLFPYPVGSWLRHLEQSYATPALQVLEGRVVYTSTPHPDRLKTEPFQVLVQSLVDQRQVELVYRNRRGDQRQLRFELLAFLNHNGVWYLVGDGQFAHRPEPLTQPTQLKLSRVLRCVPTGEPFRHRFPLEATAARLRSTYGSHLILPEGGAPVPVVLRFHGEAVVHVRESYFHRGQDYRTNEDGTVDLFLRVNDLFDALQLLGQWGDLVRPMSPPELVDRWWDRARAVAAWAAEP